MQRLFWDQEAIRQALLDFLKKHGPPLTSTRYRELRKSDPFSYPSHETIRKRLGPWIGVREQAEGKWAEKQDFVDLSDSQENRL